MAKVHLNARPDGGKTFAIAMWILGLAAGAQVVAVAWAVLTRSPVDSPPAPIAAAVEIAPAPPVVPPVPVGIPKAEPSVDEETVAPASRFPALPPMPELADPDQAPPPRPSNGARATSGDPEIFTGPIPAPPIEENPLPAPRFSGPAEPVPLSVALSEAALQRTPSLVIADPAVEHLLNAGTEKRASGNMQGALDDLRQAEVALPDHPRVLAEIAATYDEMGLDRRASLYWERLRDLGDSAAGPWHPIAVRVLSGGQNAAPVGAPRILKLGRVTAARDETVTAGERVVLNVIVEADPAARPNAEEMAMLVYFYDLVDDEHSEPTTADTAQEFPSTPYNWMENGQEIIEVSYHQPEFTEVQQRELGERRYYGYIIELYYRDELQDSAAFPPELQSLDPNSPVTPLAEPPIGPDSSLFPATPTDEE